MRVRSEVEARAHLLEYIHRHVGGNDDDFKSVWSSGDDPNATYYFVERRAGYERVLWQVGPRGAINRVWTLADWQWKALT